MLRDLTRAQDENNHHNVRDGETSSKLLGGDYCPGQRGAGDEMFPHCWLQHPTSQ